MKKIILLFLSIVCLPVLSQPLNLTDWQRPYIDKSVSNQAYTSVLNCEKKTPYYVFYNLLPNNFSGNQERSDKWPNSVSADIASICGPNYAITKNYEGYLNVYDRGHLAPAADFNANQILEDLTFSFANAAPQSSSLNRGEWLKLEKYARLSSTNHNGITIITGVIQSKNNYIKNDVGVPDYYYKILLWKDDNGQINKQAFLAQNIPGSKAQQVDINYLESLSGMNFGF